MTKPQDSRPLQRDRLTSIEPTSPVARVSQDEIADIPWGECATVEPIPAPFRQRVRRPGYKLKLNLIELLPTLLLWVGVGLVLLGAWLFTEKPSSVGWGLFAVGVPMVLWGAYAGILCVGVTGNRCIERWLRSEIARHPDSIVDPRDPESIYVSLIPREHFSQARLTYASDLLLLKFDMPQRQLLLEGDTDRYRIPATAIARCESRKFTPVIDPISQLWMVRLVVHFKDETRELLLSVDHTRWVPKTGKSRWRTAEAMCRRINSMLQREPGP